MRNEAGLKYNSETAASQAACCVLNFGCCFSDKFLLPAWMQLQRERQTPSLSSEEIEACVEHVINALIPFQAPGVSDQLNETPCMDH
jgi:hypothetical protein